MIFNKKVKGIILGYADKREVKIPMYSKREHEHREFSEYDIHRDYSYYDEFYDNYCFLYTSLKVQYCLKNKQYHLTFDNILSNRNLNKSDIVILNYNRLSKKIDIILY